MIRRSIQLASMIGILVATLAIAASAQKDGGGRLAGTWDTSVSITNCATGDTLASFLSTGSFHQGGTFNGITSGTPPAARSPEIGIWRHENGNIYGFRFKAYLYNAAGMPTGYQIVTHRIILNDDNLNYFSSGTAKVFALDGTQVASGCSSAVGTRMTLD